MGKKIIFQRCQFNNIYFLLYIIMDFLNHLIEYKLSPNDNETNESASKYFLPSQILILFYIGNISDFLAIIPYFIRNRSLKKEEENFNAKTDDTENNKHFDDSSLIYNDNKISISNKKKKTILFYLILVGILDFLHKLAFMLYSIIFKDKEMDIYPFSCAVIFEIILQFICSYFILKIHFYKLQKFSLFLNLGIFTIILIIDIINIVIRQSFDPKSYIFYAFNIIIYSIEYSYVKKILLNGFISVYILMIIKGFIFFIFVILFSLIMLLAKKDIFPRIGFFLTHTKYILLTIAKIFTNFFVSLSIWLIIDRFSPNYFPFALIFNEICYFIVELIVGEYDYKIMGWDLYFRIFLYAISFIGVMIHNEIVVINICNLGSDTKYFLDLKLKSEELFSNTDNPEIIKRYDSLNEMQTVNEENENEDSIINETKISS